MALYKQYVIVVFTLSDIADPEDFSFCPPGQPHWMQPTPSGPDLMRKIARTMTWVENKIPVMAPAAVVLHELYARSNPKEFAADEDNAVAQWVWDGKRWNPHQSPHPSKPDAGLIPNPNVRF